MEELWQPQSKESVLIGDSGFISLFLVLLIQLQSTKHDKAVSYGGIKVQSTFHKVEIQD